MPRSQVQHTLVTKENTSSERICLFYFPGLGLAALARGYGLKFKLGQGCLFFSFPAGGPAWRPWLVLKFMAGEFLNILKLGAHVISRHALWASVNRVPDLSVAKTTLSGRKDTS